jgi:hypothetical protein
MQQPMISSYYGTRRYQRINERIVLALGAMLIATNLFIIAVCLV